MKQSLLLLPFLVLVSVASLAAESPPAPEPQMAADHQAVRDVLRRYEAAMEARDLDGLKLIWPGLGAAKADEKTIEMSFKLTRSLQLELEILEVEIADHRAAVACRRRDKIGLTNGEIFENESSVTFHLSKTGVSWSIETLEVSEEDEDK